jgi:hypothetical protein
VAFQEYPVHYVNVYAEAKLALEVRLIRFPHNDLEIGPVKVTVADDVPCVRDEKLPDIRQRDGFSYHHSFPAGMF